MQIAGYDIGNLCRGYPHEWNTSNFFNWAKYLSSYLRLRDGPTKTTTYDQNKIF